MQHVSRRLRLELPHRLKAQLGVMSRAFAELWDSGEMAGPGDKFDGFELKLRVHAPCAGRVSGSGVAIAEASDAREGLGSSWHLGVLRDMGLNLT